MRGTGYLESVHAHPQPLRTQKSIIKHGDVAGFRLKESREGKDNGRRLLQETRVGSDVEEGIAERGG